MYFKKQSVAFFFLFSGVILLYPALSCKSTTPYTTGALVTHIYTADPSAHVFDGKIYIYPSHDIDTGIPNSNEGDQFNMKDYHVFSMADINKPVKDHGEVLNLNAIPWAKRQLWAPDAALKNGTYFFYFSAKDKNDIFRIGVATSHSPAGPFTAQAKPIPGSYSIDPCVFIDDDGKAYIYFGGLWGGQLEKWRTGVYDPAGTEPVPSEPALGPRVGILTSDMLGFSGIPREIMILWEDGKPLLSRERTKRFFEASWLHKYNGQYYFSYSTGTGLRIAYATGDNPLGPFTFRGHILAPVSGMTTHHSIIKYKGRWFLFYHDCSNAPAGKIHLRTMRMAEIHYNDDGTIQTFIPERS